MMTDEEFKHLTTILFRFGLDDGDNGYKYWTDVITDLKEMRMAYLAHTASVVPGKNERGCQKE